MSTESTETQQTESQSTESVEAKTSEIVSEETSSEESQGEENADQETEGEDAEGELEATEEKPKKKSGIQRLKERHNREISEIRRELERLQTQRSESQREETIVAKEEPKEEDFDSHKDYVKALAKYTYAQEKAQDEAKSKEAQAKESYKQQTKSYSDRLAKFRESNPKFDEVIEDFQEEHGDVTLTAAVNQSIVESELGPQILMELASDHKLFERINSLSATAAAREIGKIEARLEQQNKKPAPKQTTTAPAPLKPVNKGAASAVRKSIHDEGISFKDFERLRMEQLRKKRA